MKRKKYETSLRGLYVEGFSRLQDKAYYENPQGRYCKINVPDNVREFLFAVGQYAKKETITTKSGAKEEVESGHTKIVGFLTSKLPISIFRSIEKAIADKTNFDLIMQGPVADFASLTLTTIDCQLIQLGLNKLSEFLSKTTRYKTDISAIQQNIKDNEASLATSPQGAGLMAGIFGGSAIASGGQQGSIFTLNFSLEKEEMRKTSEIVRRLRIDSFRFNSVFRPLNDSSVTFDTNVFYFENFFKEYYDTQNWDANKLQEDIDIILSLANRCKRISPRVSSLVDIYQNFMSVIDVKPDSSTETLLRSYDASTDQLGKDYFKSMMGLAIFGPGPNACFYGKQYINVTTSKSLDRQFLSDIKKLLKDYGKEINRIFT